MRILDFEGILTSQSVWVVDTGALDWSRIYSSMAIAVV